MTDSNTQLTRLTLSELMLGVNSIHFDKEHNEFFAIGDFEEVALATLAGEIITIQKLPDDTKVIAQQRTPTGWQFICRKETHLTNCTISKDKIISISLKKSNETARTASWSPCGQYVAIGSEGTTISVWDTRTGVRAMHKSISWDNDTEFINPPTLSAIGWSKTGNEIITLAGEIISNNILVWDFKTQRLITIIQ